MNIIERDKKFVWHPFTQHGLEQEILPVKNAQGAWLTLYNDQKILDAISSWWVNLHGHAHPAISNAMFEQSKTLEHVMFGGFTHEPAVKLAELLVNAAQARSTQLTRCFYSDNGSTAVETALKMAYKYHKNQGAHSRKKFLALKNAYHGDTFGAMAVTARDGYHKDFSDLLPDVDFLDPTHIDDIHILEKNAEQYAACIVEPIIQSSNGMQMYPVDFLTTLAKTCKKTGVLLICDEVFTGFYRTGKLFAFEHANIQPDIVCLSKGITGGFLPLGATLATEEIFNAFKSTDINKAFLHGHTFTANPIGCAAAIASWQLLHDEKTQTAIQHISQQTEKYIQQLSTHKNATSPRTLGTIGAIDMRHSGDYFSGDSYKIRQFAINQGVLLRPLGQTLYAVPPYCITDDELAKIYQVMTFILDKQGNL